MSDWGSMIYAAISAPFALAFWSWLASFPLRLAIRSQRLLAVISIVVGWVACLAMLLSNNFIPADQRLVYLIALIFSAPLVLWWWVGRQQRLSETVHG